MLLDHTAAGLKREARDRYHKLWYQVNVKTVVSTLCLTTAFRRCYYA
jgi:hypothetical protein